MNHGDSNTIPASHIQYVSQSIDDHTQHVGVLGGEDDSTSLRHGHLSSVLA
jgi:hypothetical protein